MLYALQKASQLFIEGFVVCPLLSPHFPHLSRRRASLAFLQVVTAPRKPVTGCCPYAREATQGQQN